MEQVNVNNQTTQSELDSVDENNQIYVYSELINGVVLTDKSLFESQLEMFRENPQSDYLQWGNKEGFLKYLSKCLLKSNKYFNKHPSKVALDNPQYLDFCDGICLHEIFRHIVTGKDIEFITVQEINKVGFFLERVGLLDTDCQTQIH